MSARFVHFDLRVPPPTFDSTLTDVIIELEHLRRLRLGGTTPPTTFFELKTIFHLLESLGSAHIEGNITTLAEYVERKIEGQLAENERFKEIANM